MRSLIVYPNNPMQFSLPHSIAQLSACAVLAGDTVDIFDSTFFQTSDKFDDRKRVEIGGIKAFKQPEFEKENVCDAFFNKINDFDPDRILFSVVDNTKGLAKKLASIIPPRIETVVGGVSAILNPEDLRGHFDKVYTKTTRDFFGIERLVYDDWTIFPEERMYRPMDGKYYKTLPFITEYGCPYNCGFCCAPRLKQHLGYMQKPIGFIERELDYQIKTHNPEFIYFSSETLLTANFDKLYEKYMEYKIPFWCQTHVNTITEKRVKMLRDMNCHRVAIGIECGDPIYRKTMIGKNFSNDRAISAFKLLHDYGINASANNIIGLPMETSDMIADTVALNRKLYAVHPDMQINCYIYQPYYGTALRDFCKEKEILLAEPDTVMGEPVTRNPYISNDDIIYLRDHFTEMVKA